MAEQPFAPDFLFSSVKAVNFGGMAWVVVNAEISGAVSSLTPPPYGSFNWKLPKGTKLLSQKQITRNQTSTPGKPTIVKHYYLWPFEGGLTLPDATTYFEVITSPNAQPAFSPFAIPFTYGNQFSIVLSDNGFDFSSLAAAEAQVGRADLFGSTEALPFWTSPTSDFFNFPSSFGANELDVTTPPVPEATTDLQIEYLFQVPDTRSSFTFNAVVPPNSSARGWASVFTNQKRTIRAVTDLVGVADQSVYFPDNSSSFTITSTGKKKAGTINVNGTGGFSPGLPTNAPPSPPSGGGGG